MAILFQFAVGLTFGLGLLLSGMSDPAKVLNFLDFAGIGSENWDPSLAFVMAGAIAVTVIGYRLVLRRDRPLFGETFHLPTQQELDLRIVSGPAIFGVGWGLAGFCPGPALTALGFGTSAAMIFVAAMAAGMLLARWLANRPALSGIATPGESI
jgi:Predicted transporter component